MSLGGNSLVAAYQGKGKRTVDHQRTRVVTFIGVSDGGIRDPTRKRLTRRDTRSNEKETDTTDTRSNEKLCVKCQCLSDWCGYDIQRVRDLFRDSADYEILRWTFLCEVQETCLALWMRT